MNTPIPDIHCSNCFNLRIKFTDAFRKPRFDKHDALIPNSTYIFNHPQLARPVWCRKNMLEKNPLSVRAANNSKKLAEIASRCIHFDNREVEYVPDDWGF